jgi:tetratricopeptide (TPR) repeat protein
LENLQALSLVAEAEESRYRQHPLLADFAAEQLAAKRAVTYERMANFYVTWVARWQGERALVNREWDNLMAALQSSHSLQLWSTLAALVRALAPLWFAQARYRAARQGFAYGHQAAAQLQDHSLALFCLHHWGRACVEQDDYEEGRLHLLAGLALAGQLQDHNGIANAQYWLATIHVEQTLQDEAETRLAIARHHFELAGDREGMALVLYQQAQIFYDRGRLDDAEVCCQQALAIGVPAHSSATTQILRLLADIAIEREDYVRAANASQQALALARTQQNQDEEAGALYSLAVIARHRGQYKEAMRCAQQAREIFARTGNQGFEALTLYEVSKVQRLQGDLAAAEAVCRQSLAILRQLQHQFSLVYVLHHLGELYQLSGRPNEAKSLFQEALTLALAQDHPMIADLRQCLPRDPSSAAIATATHVPR